MRARWGLLFTACSAISGCTHGIEEQQTSAGDLLRDCVVPVPAGVAELGAPSALEYPDGSLWIWSSVALADGNVVSNASAFVEDPASLCERGPSLHGDGDAPRSMLELDAEELAANTERSDGRALRLEPNGGFVDAGVGYLFYDHVLAGPGLFDVQLLGTGLCRLEEREGACQRLRASGQSVLWLPGERFLNRGGLVADDRAWVLGCHSVAAFSDVCTLASAPLDALDDPASYQMWSAFGGWVDEASQASSILEHSGAVTLSRLDGKYAAISLDIFASRFRVQLSRELTGAFDEPTALFDAVPPDSFFLAGGREHSGLRRDSRTVHVSYATNRAGAEHGLHLASFRLFGGLQ